MCHHQACTAVLKPSRDFLFIMGGKVKSNDVEIQKQLSALKYEFKAVTLNYSIPMMKAACYVKQMRGFANSGAVEVCYLCWKGTFPKNCAKSRAHIDAGSPTYCDFMSKVPIATIEELTVVPINVRIATQSILELPKIKCKFLAPAWQMETQRPVATTTTTATTRPLCGSTGTRNGTQAELSRGSPRRPIAFGFHWITARFFFASFATN